MAQELIPTIGLEIHAELKTRSKMFCGCANNPDEEKPNALVCPICMGHPGTLPVLNFEAIRHVLRVGHALNAKIADYTEWDRKNYFYPDIPKGYQISQYAYPLVEGGELAGVKITRIHLEEDTAQSTHDIHEKSLVNFNRAGVPLMELVTEPVIHDSETAVRFAEELQLVLRYLGAGDAHMEKGHMRVEANISVATREDTDNKKFGTKTEVKNLNSFRAVERAIAYEIKRQSDLIARGEKVVQETRGWDDSTQTTFSQRKKESSHDYRYFPDPDLPHMMISEIAEFKPETLRATLPELPWEKRNRYAQSFGLKPEEVEVFVTVAELGKFFEKVAQLLDNKSEAVKLSVNYILTDYVGFIKKDFGENIAQGIDKVSSERMADIIKLIQSGKLSSRGAKDLLKYLYDTLEDNSLPPRTTEEIAQIQGLIQNSNEGELKAVCTTIVAANPTVVADFKSGKASALQFLLGQAMKTVKASGSSANPELLRKILTELLS